MTMHADRTHLENAGMCASLAGGVDQFEAGTDRVHGADDLGHPGDAVHAVRQHERDAESARRCA